MNVAIYARVSSEVQEQRGTIGSQLEVLRARMAAEGHEIVAEFLDDGYSGARLDRPGLDALRDAAEAGVIEAVWCLTPDRLARSYAYQMLVLDELDRLGCQVRFTDAPAIDDDPQARLLTQMQGVIAEYEKAKVAERNRRGKLYRARAGEIPFWKVSYGHRRVIPRAGVRGSRSSSPRPRSCARSSQRTSSGDCRFARSRLSCVTARSNRRPASHSGERRRSTECYATRRTSARSTTTATNGSRARLAAARPACASARARSGSRSRCRRLSTVTRLIVSAKSATRISS